MSAKLGEFQVVVRPRSLKVKIIEGIDLTPELLGEFVMETLPKDEWNKKNILDK